MKIPALDYIITINKTETDRYYRGADNAQEIDIIEGQIMPKRLTL